MNILDDYLNNTVNKSWNFSGHAINKDMERINALLGLAGEAGEVLDIYKKAWFHTPKDRSEELKLELGDLFYYLTKVVDLSGFTVEEILQANHDKLAGRYPTEFGK